MLFRGVVGNDYHSSQDNGSLLEEEEGHDYEGEHKKQIFFLKHFTS